MQSKLLCLVLLALFYSANASIKGACCADDGACSISTKNKCSGTYLGNFSTCSPFSCLGACCTGGQCSETSRNDCAGTFTRAGVQCNDVGGTCDVLGACCTSKAAPNPSCEELTIQDCYNNPNSVINWINGGTCDVQGICPFVLTPFIDPLAIPAVKKPDAGVSGCPKKSYKYTCANYTITSKKGKKSFHSQLPNKITFHGYDGKYPGSTILACNGASIEVKFVNELPSGPHPLGFDGCPHGPNFRGDTNRQVIHLHGGINMYQFDGQPEYEQQPGQNVTYKYDFPAHMGGSLVWYHDHSLGITRKNVYMGLFAGLLLQDKREAELNLPAGKFEIPLIFQDKSFYYAPDGTVQLYFPSNYQVNFPFAADEFVGTQMLVNGMVKPYHRVKPTLYRLRFLNGANSRSFTFAFTTGDPSKPLDFTVIGSDQGFLASPAVINSISMSPAERFDVLFDFSEFAGKSIYIFNSAKNPFPNGEFRQPNFPNGRDLFPLREVMRFVVSSSEVDQPSGVIPSDLPLRQPAEDVDSVVRTRSFLLDFSETGTCSPTTWLIRKFKEDQDPSAGFFDSENQWDMKSTIMEDFYPKLGTTEIWEFWNPTPVVHPMHIHLVAFEVLSRSAIDPDSITDSREGMTLTNEEIPVDPVETGRKDTVKAFPNQVVRVIATFGPYQGKYPIHCHLVDHEDNEMMKQFRVIDPDNVCAISSAAVCGNGICEAGNGENCQSCSDDCFSGSDFCCGYGESSVQLNDDGTVVLPGQLITDRIPETGDGIPFVGCPDQCKPGFPKKPTKSCRVDFVESCCGDGFCEPGENTGNCAPDCGALPQSGGAYGPSTPPSPPSYPSPPSSYPTPSPTSSNSHSSYSHSSSHSSSKSSSHSSKYY